MEDDISELITNTDADAPDAGGTSGPSPSDPAADVDGDIDDLVAEVEAEVAQQMGAAKPKPSATAAPETSSAPTPKEPSEDPLQQIVDSEFGGDRARAAAYFKDHPGRLAAMEQAIRGLQTPVDQEGAEKALQEQIRADAEVVDHNREIEAAEAEIKRLHTENARTLQSLAKLQREADILDGRAEEAAEDRKDALRAQAAQKRSEIASLNTSLNSNDRSIKEAERDKKSQERRLTQRVTDIRNAVVESANQQARERGEAIAVHNAFQRGIKEAVRDLGLKKFSGEDTEFVRSAVIRAMNKDTSPEDWPASKVQAVTAKAVEVYARANGRTAGAKAVALARKAPSDPRPASTRLATPTPRETGVTEEMMRTPEYWRKRSRGLESKGIIGATRGRR